MDDQQPNAIDAAEVLHWIEFCAWASAMMTPIIWCLQGASVSTDQFLVRTALMVVSIGTAIGLRGWTLFQLRQARSARRERKSADPLPEQRT